MTFGKILGLAAALTVAGVAADSSAAGVVSVAAGTNQWGIDNGHIQNVDIAPGESAGVVPATNWNNLPNGGAASLSNVNDDTGTATTIDVSLSAPDAWNTSTSTSTPNGKLFYNSVKSNSLTASASLTLSEVPAGIYDLYVYTMSGDGAGRNGAYTVGGTTYYVENQDSGAWNSNPAFDQASSTTAGSPDVGNYIRFSNISPVDGTIALSWIATAPTGGGDVRAAVNGIQLVDAVPEPAALGGLSFGLAGLVLRRRR